MPASGLLIVSVCAPTVNVPADRVRTLLIVRLAASVHADRVVHDQVVDGHRGRAADGLAAGPVEGDRAGPGDERAAQA